MRIGDLNLHSFVRRTGRRSLGMIDQARQQFTTGLPHFRTNPPGEVMVALIAPVRGQRKDQVQQILLNALAAATPTSLPGCDGMTIDVLLGQYDALSHQGLVPTRQELVGHRLQAA
jgi:hypothetical protein